MVSEPASAFTARLRDLLATIETSALLAAAETRLRGLGEHLQFACLAIPCQEALCAIEVARLGRLRVPGVATPDGWRATDHEFLPSGTPFAYLLGGGAGHAVQLEPGDGMIESLRPVLHTEPVEAIFVPLRVGSSVLGGAALFSDGAAGQAADWMDRALSMAERLAEVLALTLESFRTERVLHQLFAAALPTLYGPDAVTGFGQGVGDLIHRLRLAPAYRRRLVLAEIIGRIAAQGEAESQLMADVLGRVDAYLETIGGERSAEGPAVDWDDEL